MWFAFILWTTDIYNNLPVLKESGWLVVICFHSLNYWYLQQPFILLPPPKAVVICFHSLNYWYLQQQRENIIDNVEVVICFHSLNYWYLQQRSESLTSFRQGCDLLSFFELLIFTTTRMLIYFLTYRCDLLSFFELLIFTTTVKC